MECGSRCGAESRGWRGQISRYWILAGVVTNDSQGWPVCQYCQCDSCKGNCFGCSRAQWISGAQRGRQLDNRSDHGHQPPDSAAVNHTASFFVCADCWPLGQHNLISHHPPSANCPQLSFATNTCGWARAGGCWLQDQLSGRQRIKVDGLLV